MKQAELLPAMDEDTVRNDRIVLHLPWPPSVNHYLGKRTQFPKLTDIIARQRTHGFDNFHQWLRKNSHVQAYLTNDAKAYAINVWSVVNRAGARVHWTDPVKISAKLFPPDRRVRDNSNLWKCIEDALQHAGVVVDDNQFVEHHDVRGEVVKGGLVVVKLELLLN